MNLTSKHLEAASLLILLIKVFCVNTLTCHPTEYLVDNECCPLCPPGNRVKTDCTEFRSTSCLLCENNTFMNLSTGRTKCFPCTTCGPDSGLKINTSCTATTDSVCEPLEGFYCIEGTRNNCAAAKKHTQCKPGQYIKHRGTALTDSECSDCSNGTFSDGTRSSCQPHTQCESLILQLKRQGTTSTDAECKNNVPVLVGIIASVFLIVLCPLVFILWKMKTCHSGKRRNPTEHRSQRHLACRWKQLFLPLYLVDDRSTPQPQPPQGNTTEGEAVDMMENT